MSQRPSPHQVVAGRVRPFIDIPSVASHWPTFPFRAYETDARPPLPSLCHASTSPARPVVGTGQKPTALHRSRGLQLNVQWEFTVEGYTYFSTGKLGYLL